jgi:Apyrase.
MTQEAADLQRIHRYRTATTQYQLAIITDEDQAARTTLEDGQVAWSSTLRYDTLIREWDPQQARAQYQFEPVPRDQGGINQLISIISEGDRGAEFSELAIFGSKLLTFDDRTGLVCEVRGNNHLVPRQILMTGSGDEQFKGFKCEWATLKDDQLIVGSHGRPKARNGQLQTGELEWVKVLDTDYRLQSINWHEVYERMRQALGIDSTRGYITHEAVEWHPLYRQWYFFPRKLSYEPFDEPKDEREKGTNVMIITDENFENIRYMTIGERKPERGVSSFKFIPGRSDECVGLKSVEVDDRTETYIFAFDLDGNMLSDEVFLGNYKCEGVEIL